jgi:hypothetical protein
MAKKPYRLPIDTKQILPLSWHKAICKHCQKEFWKRGKRSGWWSSPRFCSEECARNVCRLNRKESRANVTKHRLHELKFSQCEGCGSTFDGKAERASKRFCSNACRQRAYRQRNANAAKAADGGEVPGG